MFKRFHDWVRGSKNYVPTVSTASKDKKKAKFKVRPRSKTEGAIPSSSRQSENFDDGFRRNDIDAFDIVLAPESNGKLGGEGIQHTHRAQSMSMNELDTSKSVHEPDSPTKECDSKSAVDLVLPQQTQNMDATEETKLSLDEMQTLELLDSIVQDLETSQYYDNLSENIELGKNETKTVDTDSFTDDTEFQKALTVVDNKIQSIDYSHVLGETHGDQPSSAGQPDNWEITGFTAMQKPLRFVSKEMYLPSSEPQRREIESVKVPELPPTDYPETDNEDKDLNNVEHEEMRDALQSRHFSVPTVTSFSSKPSPIQRMTSYDDHDSAGNITVQSSMTKNPKWSLTNGSMPNLAVNGLDKNSKRSTNTACTAEGYTSVTANGLSETFKRPKPDVTSFKSCTLPPRITIEPVAEMMKRLENHQTSETF